MNYRGPEVGGQVESEYGLECRSYPTGYKNCYTRRDDDLDIVMQLGLWGAPLQNIWDMKFYSRSDALWVKLSFPGIGQSRWPEVVCRTLFLVRP